jgi:hypothetical protein
MSTNTDTPYVHMELRDGILIATYKKGLNIDLKMAERIIRSRLDFTEGRKLPVLIRNQGVITINKEAREYLSSVEGTTGLSAAAIILNSPFEFVLGVFFVKVNGSLIPSKVFSDEASAMKWLKKFLRH